MKKTWQEILDGKNHPSDVIKGEISKLTGDGRELESGLVELENSLRGLQKDLLAGIPGSSEAVRAIEANISESRNKVSAISGVIKELEEKLTEVLVDEQKNRLAEIRTETALIDEQASKKRDELVTAYSRACVLFIEITGREAHNLDFRYFMDCDLTKPLQNRIQEIAPAGPSLFRQRENLSNESIRLRKSP